MENQKVNARPVMSKEEAEKVRNILAGLFPAGCCHDPEQMEEKSRLLLIASDMLLKAAIVHRGEQIPWASMCWSAFVPSVSNAIRESAEVIQQMLGVLCVDVKVPLKIKRGMGLPNFVPAQVLPQQ